MKITDIIDNIIAKVNSNTKWETVHNAVSKTTPVDADEIGLVDSTASWGLKKLTWANLKTALGNLFVSKITSTTNKLVKFSNTSSGLADSIIYDDGVNAGIGVTPNSWSGYGAPVLNVHAGSPIVSKGDGLRVGSNWYYSGGKYYRAANGLASFYNQGSGIHYWSMAVTGGADTEITAFHTAMTLGANGNLLIGTTTDNGVDKLQVNGGISATSFNGVKSIRKTIQPGTTGWTTMLTITFGLYVASSVEVSVHSQRLDGNNDTAFTKIYITALRWAGDVFNQRITVENKTLTSGTVPSFQLVVSGASLLLQVNVQAANQRFNYFCESVDGFTTLS